MWVFELQRTLKREPCVVVTVAEVIGSAPRAAGSRMLVTGDALQGSIGGGNLEFEATAKARKLLEHASKGVQQRKRYGLGPALNQCCGGSVTLLYEGFDAAGQDWLERLARLLESRQPALLVTDLEAATVSKCLVNPADEESGTWSAELRSVVKAAGDVPEPFHRFVETATGSYLVEKIQAPLQPLYLFGAGHVGKAVARALEPLPFEVTWFDSRPDPFPPQRHAGASRVQSADPALEVAACAPGGIYVVMTHSHALDEDICLRVLQRGDAAWLGLIGSKTKRRRFVHRLQQRGVSADAAERLVCPIGLPGITGKRPATIAVALVAQLLKERVPKAWR